MGVVVFDGVVGCGDFCLLVVIWMLMFEVVVVDVVVMSVMCDVVMVIVGWWCGMMGVGVGIVFDSVVVDEYVECELKV